MAFARVRALKIIAIIFGSLVANCDGQLMGRKHVGIVFQVSFNAQTPQHGWLKEWTLMLHGTREPPYTGLSVADPRSKLAIVKKAHEERLSAI